jgi:hypothetical protein
MLNKNVRRNRGRKGSVVIESSLVLVVFLVISVGIADIGQFLFQHHGIVERVRTGLRYGVITYDPTAIRNIVLYGTATPAEGATPSFYLTSDMVAVSRADANTNEDRVMITVSNYPIKFLTPFIAGNATGKPIVGVLPMELGNLP